MLESVPNTQRSSVRTTLFWAAICAGMVSLFFMVVSAYVLIIKPHYLTKETPSAIPEHVASWYGSQDNLLKRPTDVALNKQGMLYVCDSGTAEIVVFDRYGQRVKAFGKGTLKAPVSLAISRDGQLYVVDAQTKELLIFTSKGVLKKTISFSEEPPLAVEVGPAQAAGASSEEALYVATASGIAVGKLDGVFLRGYFNGGEGAGQLRGSAALSVAQSAQTASTAIPRLFVADALAQRTWALDSFETSPTESWRAQESFTPGGAVSDAAHVYLTDVLNGRIVVLDARTGEQTATFAREGSRDGELTAPRGVALFGQQLYVADAGNGRIEIYNTPSASGAKIETTPLWLVILLVGLCGVFAAGSLALLAVRMRIAQKRYLVDFSVAEKLGDERVRLGLERVATRVGYPADIEEWVLRGLKESMLRAQKVNVSQKSAAAIEESYPAFDAFDQQALAAALTSKRCIVTLDDEVRKAAHELGIETTSPELLRLRAQEDVAHDAGFTQVSAVVFLALTVVLTLLLCAAKFALPSQAFARQAGVEHSTVLLSSLQKPTKAQEKDCVRFSDTSATYNHASWQKQCSLCHESSLDQDDTRALSSTTRCEYCHAGSGLGGAVGVYLASKGDAHALGAKNSGHALGYYSQVSASSREGASELTCLSCHNSHTKITRTDVASCTDCHDKARASQAAIDTYQEDKATRQNATDHFELSGSVKAHGANDPQQNGNAAHSAAGLSCATCHRGGLEAAGSECSTCHYADSDFEKDKRRAQQRADWPHASTNDTALLGNWTTSAEGESLGKKVTLSEGMTLENQTRTACGRCHTTKDGTTFATSVHTLAHDSVRSGMVEHITSTATTSTLAATSPGYISTGGVSQSSPFASSFEFGPEDGSFEGVACSACHYSDVQTEHTLRSDKGCAACHDSKTKQGKTDWTQTRGSVTRDAFASCGTSESACHQSSWHGSNPDLAKKAHRLFNSAGKALKKTSCSADESGRACHGAQSAQSLFHFGAQDLASAHNDYWVAQKQNYSTNTRYTETISSIDTVRGCGLCHDKQTAQVNGADQAARARKGNASFDCKSCHKNETAVYAEDACFKADSWKAPSRIAEKKAAQEDALTKEAKEYLSKLALQTQEKGDRDDAESNGVLKPATTEGISKKIPEEFLPLTKPLSPLSPFSLIRGHLAPWPSILNTPTQNWENV